MRSNPDPRVSVIVIAYAPPALLARCLAALRTQRAAAPDVEILVVAHPAHLGESFAPVKAEFADFTWIDAPADYNVARLRGLGVGASHGEFVTLLEGDCVPAGDWLARLRQVAPAGALGGAIEPRSFARALDWAGYFCEFGPFLAPLPPAPQQLPGTNVTYRRAALPTASTLETDGFYETFVNSAIAQREGLASDDTLVVHHQREWRAGTLIATRYNHGRGFAALRVGEAPFVRRAPYVLLAILLPAVLVARTLAEPLRHRRHVGRALYALPWIVVLSLSWSFGELLGYAVGAGTSLERWR